METLYQQFLHDPTVVGPDWCVYFNALTAEPVAAPSIVSDQRQIAVLQLINAYRFLGVRQADLDPLYRFTPVNVPELDPAHYGLTDEDANVLFETGSLCAPAQATLDEILAVVRRAYCGTLSAEYMYISDYPRKRWLQQRLEGDMAMLDFPAAQQKRIMQDLTAAETLEKFLHTRYVGQKRFSLEGAETLIPMLHHLIEAAAIHGVQEIVLGMAHRGRINVLVNLLGKPLQQIFGALPADSCTEQLGRAGRWHERLPHFRMDFTPSAGEELQTEYLLPRANALAALRAARALREPIGRLLMISEIRTVAADRLWMSPCYQQPCVALHFTWQPDWPAVSQLLPRLEAQLAPLGARPHWGKLFTMAPAQLQAGYPRLADFRQLLHTYDPEGKFRNAFASFCFVLSSSAR